MTLFTNDFVRESGTTAGPNLPISLKGATSGYGSFSSAGVLDGQEMYYAVLCAFTKGKELRKGVYSAKTNSLSVEQIIYSTNPGYAPIQFGGQPCEVWPTNPAQNVVTTDGGASPLQLPALGGPLQSNAVIVATQIDANGQPGDHPVTLIQLAAKVALINAGTL